MTRERSVLLGHLHAERHHVLLLVDGLGEESMTSAVASSRWSIAQLLNHRAYDAEILRACAIVGADKEAIGLIQDGWNVPATSGVEAVERYRSGSNPAVCSTG